MQSNATTCMYKKDTEVVKRAAETDKLKPKRRASAACTSSLAACLARLVKLSPTYHCCSSTTTTNAITNTFFLPSVLSPLPRSPSHCPSLSVH